MKFWLFNLTWENLELFLRHIIFLEKIEMYFIFLSIQFFSIIVYNFIYYNIIIYKYIIFEH